MRLLEMMLAWDWREVLVLVSLLLLATRDWLGGWVELLPRRKRVALV